MLDRSTNRLSRRGAAVKNLAHSASFHSNVKIAPSNPGIKHLAKLEGMGVDSISDLRDLEPRPVRKAMTVVGGLIIHELRGVCCLPLELLPAQRNGCVLTRPFSSRIEAGATMEQAVSAHATRLGEKVRRGGLGTTHVLVFYHTSEHDCGDPTRSVSTTVTLPEATNGTLAADQGGA